MSIIALEDKVWMLEVLVAVKSRLLNSYCWENVSDTVDKVQSTKV
jgi:hypothetical protein